MFEPTGRMMGARARLPGVILLTAFLAACATGGAPARPAPFPQPPSAASPTAPAVGTTVGLAAVERALALRGSPYAPGGAGPDRFDCSGLVQFVYRSLGIDLPRTVIDQREVTRRVRPEAVRPGDLLFFRTEGRKPSHVAIALGDGSFVHAPSGRGEVRVEHLGLQYWRARFESARRVPGSD